MKEALNGRPVKERTRREYQRAIDSYRRVYFGAPTSTKADASVVSVAELMVEMGRRFEDDEVLRSAIKQYEFLRREYPGSKYRVQALFTIGEIYKDDLDDPDRARETFQEFVRRYPHNSLVEQARQELAAPTPQTANKAKSAEKPDKDEQRDKPATDSTGSTATASKNEDKLARVTGIRHWSTPDYTRVAIDLEQEVKYTSQRIDNPDRIFFDLLDTKLASTLVGKTFDVDDGFLKKIRVAQFQPGKTRVVLEVDQLADYSLFLLPNPARLIIDVRGKQIAKPPLAKDNPAPTEAANKDDSEESPEPAVEKTTVSARPVPSSAVVAAKDDPDDIAPDTIKTVRTTSSGATVVKKKVVAPDDDDTPPVAKLEAPTPKLSTTPATSSRRTRSKKTSPPTPDTREARPTADGDRSLIRALGLKIGRIVIDPGHGGHDTGTIGPRGLLEKDLVLDVALRLGKLLQTQLGADVVYTRKDDTFIPLETRTAIANQEQADLFVSVHANSSHDPDARGVETYYLNFTSSPEALEVAARENAVSDKSIHELQDLVKKIALKEKIEESREFASDVQHALHSGLAQKNSGMRDRGVKKAPFIVLIGANMPSILAEISFVSNPGDEKRLRTPEYRQKIAESLYRGISRYVGGLSGIKVATKLDKVEAQ